MEKELVLFDTRENYIELDNGTQEWDDIAWDEFYDTICINAGNSAFLVLMEQTNRYFNRAKGYVGGKTFNRFEQAMMDIRGSRYDDFIFFIEGKELKISALRHDGVDTFTFKRLTAKGKELINEDDFSDDRTAHEKLVNEGMAIDFYTLSV